MYEKSKRIYLSPPDLTDLEIDFVVAAMQSGWVSSQGPDVKIFEQEMAKKNNNSKFATKY